MTAGSRDRRVRVPGFAVAGLVLLVLAVGSLAPAIGTATAERRAIAADRAAITAQRANIRALDAQIAAEDDPVHLRAEAASRLLFAVPGETTYRVVGVVPAAAATPAPAADPGWASQLLRSVVAAGRP